MLTNNYHQPVLLQEAIKGLAIVPNGVYIDATFGGGGHSRLILEQLNANGQLFVFDQDSDAIKNLPENEPRCKLINANFGYIQQFMRIEGIAAVNGILADLGVSWHQINTEGRGFSYRFDSDILDMRMNKNSDAITAKDIVNEYNRARLVTIFSNYGELTNANKIAEAIVANRRIQNIETIGQLKTIVEPLIYGNKMQWLSQLFQALRMEVNNEVLMLKQFLQQSANLLTLNARLVVITYHSIEDRLVKNFIKYGTTDGQADTDIYGNRPNPPLNMVNKKVISPQIQEVKENPKSRSAKMRIAEKVY